VRGRHHGSVLVLSMERTRTHHHRFNSPSLVSAPQRIPSGKQAAKQLYENGLGRLGSFMHTGQCVPGLACCPFAHSTVKYIHFPNNRNRSTIGR